MQALNFARATGRFLSWRNLISYIAPWPASLEYYGRRSEVKMNMNINKE